MIDKEKLQETGYYDADGFPIFLGDEVNWHRDVVYVQVYDDEPCLVDNLMDSIMEPVPLRSLSFTSTKDGMQYVPEVQIYKPRLRLVDLIRRCSQRPDGKPLSLPSFVKFDGGVYNLVEKDDPGQNYYCEEHHCYLSQFAFDPHGALECVVYQEGGEE